MRLTADASGARWMTGAAACVLTFAGAFGGAGTALAQSTPEPTPESQVDVPEAVPGEEVCAIADPRLTELSGLAATGDGGYIAVNDGQDFDDTRRPIFFLDSGCAVVDEQSFFPGQPRDPEGMELSGDGSTLWVGDIGDNAAGGTGEGDTRVNIALWRVDLSGGDRTPLIHRFNYPDEPHDAEALLLDGDGTPIIVTKELGVAGLYVPTEVVPSQSPDQFVPLEQVGEFSPPDTGTDNPFQSAGRQVITGGAVSPDGSRVVLRTYADAFEFDVTDGDVVGAITNGEPRVTPLPDEPQGESITYSADGEQFLTVSEVLDQELPEATILEYTPTEPAPDPPPTQAAAGGTETSDSGGGSLFNSVQDIINLIAGVGVVGLLLVAAGVFGIVRARRRATSGGDDGADDPDDGQPTGLPTQGRARPSAAPEPGWEPDPAGRVQAAAGVYTSARAVADAEPAPGYGAGPAYPEGEYRGTEYGAGGYGGAEYPAGTAGAEYGGTTYGGAEYGGATYNGAYAGGEYAAQPHGDYRGENYHGGEYRGGEYRGGEYRSEYGAGAYQDQPYDQAWAEADGGRGGYVDPYHGNGGPPAQPAPDYYSDDPDYPYEFRGHRW